MKHWKKCDILIEKDVSSSSTSIKNSNQSNVEKGKDMGYFRLCGGTLFTLVVDAALKKPTNGDLYTGADNLITDENMLTNLLRIAIPSFSAVSRDDAQNFKQCKVKQSKNLKMINCEIGKALQDRMKSDYLTCYEAMSMFISKFLDTSQEKDKKLIRALLELIEQDQDILPNQTFYVCPDGKAICKRDMSDMVVINIPAFLLGVLLFTLTEVKDNRVGSDTYNTWCPTDGNAHTRRYYQGNMGEAITRTLSFDNSVNQQTASTQRHESPTVVNLSGESKKHPLPRIPAPNRIVESERKYVNALLDVYREKTSVHDLTLDDLSAYPDLDKHLKRQRDDYFDAELLRRGTRDIYSNDGEEYFDVFLEEILTGVIDTFEAEYDSGYARLGAVLTAAAQTSTEQCFISRDTLWVGNHQKKGACHVLINRKKLSVWV